MKGTIVTLLILHVFVWLADIAHADDEGDKKRKIEKKFEVVSWGEKQSLRDNIKRVMRAIASEGLDYSVYRQRNDELQLHWDDADRKFEAAKVDTRSEPVYFGFIEWTDYDSLTRLPKDHFLRFYVAARKNSARSEGAIKRRFEAYRRDQLKRELEACDEDALKSALESIDRKTLKIGLEQVDARTLRNGLELLDRDTLKVALEVIDRPTLRKGLEGIDRQTLKVGLAVIDRATLKIALHEIDLATLKAATEVMDDDTYELALQTVGEGIAAHMKEFRR